MTLEMVEFTPTDSDLVFRRKERSLLLGTVAFEAVFFAAIFLVVLMNKRTEAFIAGVWMVLALLTMGLVAAWTWSFEVRMTPYEFVVRSIFRTNVVPYSSINRIERKRVGGKVPAQYHLRVHIHEGPTWTVPDVSDVGTSVLAELRSRCRNAEVIDEHLPAMSVHNPSDE